RRHTIFSRDWSSDVCSSDLYADARKRNPFSLNASGFGADPWLYLYRWSRLFPIGVQENGDDLIDPAFAAKSSNDEITANRYLNMNLGTTLNFTDKWDLQADYAYTTENISETSSVPYVQGRTHWYGVGALRDESGSQVYVDENGNPTGPEGMMAYRFPMTDHTLKENTYFRQSSFRSKMHTFNVVTNYNLDLDAHQFKFMLGSNIVAYTWMDQFSKRGNLLNDDNPQFGYTVGTKDAGGRTNWDSQAGLFGLINYAFNGKYLFETSLRRDATSKF